MWQTDRILTPSKPHSRTVRARCRRIGKKLQEQRRAYQPHRIAEAVREPLIRYQKWKRGELQDIPFFEEGTFQDPVLFWIHWLEGMQDAVPHRLQSAELDPIRDLTQLLDDLRSGARSKLTDQFVEARRKKSKSRKVIRCLWCSINLL